MFSLQKKKGEIYRTFSLDDTIPTDSKPLICSKDQKSNLKSSLRKKKKGKKKRKKGTANGLWRPPQ